MHFLNFLFFLNYPYTIIFFKDNKEIIENLRKNCEFNLNIYIDMNLSFLSITFLINAGGLFDFDLTFLAEGLLFFLLSLVVTFVFLNPISEQLNARSTLINFNLRKSSIVLNLGYEKLSKSIDLLTEEISELSRQLKASRAYSFTNFENEISGVQSKSLKLLSKVKGDLSIKSALILSSLSNELTVLTNNFFTKKFQSTY